jgi:N-methylhydantoinase B
MISLCYDLPWAIGALRNVVDFVSEEGTLNNATSPAAVSMASVMGALTTMDVASIAFAKMLQSTATTATEAQASWSPGLHGGLFLSLGERGAPAVSALCDPFGGGAGARTYADGIDTGGVPHSMASRVSNVEVLESRAPMLQVWRREIRDSGGPGRFRGGVSLEYGGIAHKASGPSLYQTLASGFAVPGGRGLSGGFPGSAASGKILRGSDIADLFAAGRVPTSAQELKASAVDVQAAKEFTVLGPGDLVIGALPGGSGFGDPLRRDPDAVAADIAKQHVSPDLATSAYGVVLVDGRVDESATAAERDRQRSLRLLESTAAPGATRHGAQLGGEVMHPVSDTVEAFDLSGVRLLRCTVCQERLSNYTEDFKHGCLMRELPLQTGMSANADCDPNYVLREYSCPGCGTALTVDVQERSEPIMDELRFAPRPPANGD